MDEQSKYKSSIKKLYSFHLADRVLHRGRPVEMPFVEFDKIDCRGVFFVVLVLEEDFKPIYNDRGEAHAHLIMDYENENRLTHVATTNFPIRRHPRLEKSFGNVHFFRATEIRWPDPQEAIFLRNDATPLGMFDLLQMKPIKANLEAYKGVTIGLLRVEVLTEGEFARTPLDYMFPMVMTVSDLDQQRLIFTTIGGWAERLSDALLL